MRIMFFINHLGRLVSRMLSVKHTRKFILTEADKDILLWEADLPPKHPDYMTVIPIKRFDEQFTRKCSTRYKRN